MKVGLVLPGGGARGAYQAGVLKAVCQITNEIGIEVPFSILSGISVGAINVALLAAHADDLCAASSQLVSLWDSIKTKEVIRTDPISLGKIVLRWSLELSTGGIIKHKKARSLLDNSPLSRLIDREVEFNKIQDNIDKGHLDGVVITAVNYTDGSSYNFYQTNEEIEPWVRTRRTAIQTKITKDHILASMALPIYFPPHKIGKSYFADGNLRNNTPLSPSIKLGAEKLLVIPVRRKSVAGEDDAFFEPTLGRMISVLLNSMLLDAIDFDFERLSRINETLDQLKPGGETPLKKIDVCMIRPSEDIGKIAYEEAISMPRSLRYFIEGLGSAEEAEGLISILLFESSFTQRLIELGYKDAMNQKEEIINFYI